MSIWDWIRILAVTIGPIAGFGVYITLRSWGVDPLIAFGCAGIGYTLAAAATIYGGLCLFVGLDGDHDAKTTTVIEV